MAVATSVQLSCSCAVGWRTLMALVGRSLQLNASGGSPLSSGLK